MWQECSLCEGRGDMIDSYSSHKRRARIRIKARRDRKAERGPIAIQSSSFFSSFHSETPLFTALRCSCAAALPPSPRRDSPPTTRRDYLLRSRTTHHRAAAARIGITRTVDASCTRMHAPSCESRPRRAPMRTNNLTPQGGAGHLPAARSRVINNVSSTLREIVHDAIRREIHRSIPTRI